MGFKRQQLYKLKFVDPDMEGLEVTVRMTSIGATLEHQAREKAAKDADDGAALSKLRVDQLAQMLVEWNLEDDDGQPVPATAEGVMAQDMKFIVYLLNTANDAIYGISDPLDESSTSGEMFPEASLPMEPLSPSPSSSPMLVS